MPDRSAERAEAMARVIMTRAMIGICHMQVCAVADATDDEILAVCNRENPSGTTHGWSEVCRSNSKSWGETAPAICEKYPGRRHFLVSC